jgi:lysozyme family protein
LWSFCNLYEKGKYVADGKYDPNAVSKQCGAGVMLKTLAEQQVF